MMLLPRYLIIILAFYAVIFLVSITYFIVPAISLGLGYLPEFYVSLLIIFLPLILFIVYFFNLVSGHDTILRIAIAASAIISFIYFFVFILTLLI